MSGLREERVFGEQLVRGIVGVWATEVLQSRRLGALTSSLLQIEMARISVGASLSERRTVAKGRKAAPEMPNQAAGGAVSFIEGR